MKKLATIIHEAKFSGTPSREELLHAVIALESLCSLSTDETFNKRYQMALKKNPKEWVGTPLKKLWKELENDEGPKYF